METKLGPWPPKTRQQLLEDAIERTMRHTAGEWPPPSPERLLIHERSPDGPLPGEGRRWRVTDGEGMPSISSGPYCIYAVWSADTGYDMYVEFPHDHDLIACGRMRSMIPSMYRGYWRRSRLKVVDVARMPTMGE